MAKPEEKLQESIDLFLKMEAGLFCCKTPVFVFREMSSKLYPSIPLVFV